MREKRGFFLLKEIISGNLLNDIPWEDNYLPISTYKYCSYLFPKGWLRTHSNFWPSKKMSKEREIRMVFF